MTMEGCLINRPGRCTIPVLRPIENRRSAQNEIQFLTLNLYPVLISTLSQFSHPAELPMVATCNFPTQLPPRMAVPNSTSSTSAPPLPNLPNPAEPSLARPCLHCWQALDGATSLSPSPLSLQTIRRRQPHLVIWTTAPTQLLHLACREPPRPTPSPSHTGTTTTPGPTPPTRRRCAAPAPK
jgi:hypothetical protein